MSQMQQSPNVTGLSTEETLLAIAGFLTDAYNYFSVTYPSATQEVYVYKTGGSGGTTVATITINYTDSTKMYILNATKA